MPKHFTSHYDVGPILDAILRERWLAPNAIVDWGGGGEPTLMPVFDYYLQPFADYGVTQRVHTNGTRIPRPVAEGSMDTSRLKVLCSVDAGSREVFHALKEKDLYDVVWHNLSTYVAQAAEVTVKYLVTPENCSPKEIEGFVNRVVAHEIPSVVGDIDHRFPTPEPPIVIALAYLEVLLANAGVPYTFGSTGDLHNPESDVSAAIQKEKLMLTSPTHASL